MKLRAHRAGNNGKTETKSHWTTNVARYTMRENHAHDTSEDLREAIARSSGLSSQESKAA